MNENNIRIYSVKLQYKEIETFPITENENKSIRLTLANDQLDAPIF
jgi:hypothetical protein